MLKIRMTVKRACCMALALALGAAATAAQQRSTPAPEERGDLDAIRKVSTLIGTPVVNRANSTIAHLRDLVLSPEGDVPYAVLGYGGVGGIGETQTAVPMDALEIRQADGKWAATLEMTADDVKKAPTIRSENYRELTDPQWVASVDQFFRPRDESKARPEAGTGSANRPSRAVERVLLATKIRHSELKNPQNEDLGKIEDLLLNRMQRVGFLIVGTGGTFSVGENYVPVPWSRLGLATNPENALVTVSVNATKPQLETAPLVKGGDYATLLDAGFADKVRDYFVTISRGATTGTGSERR